jgi:hypothetical protein
MDLQGQECIEEGLRVQVAVNLFCGDTRCVGRHSIAEPTPFLFDVTLRVEGGVIDSAKKCIGEDCLDLPAYKAWSVTNGARATGITFDLRDWELSDCIAARSCRFEWEYPKAGVAGHLSGKLRGEFDVSCIQ